MFREVRVHFVNKQHKASALESCIIYYPPLRTNPYTPDTRPSTTRIHRIHFPQQEKQKNVYFSTPSHRSSASQQNAGTTPEESDVDIPNMASCFSLHLLPSSLELFQALRFSCHRGYVSGAINRTSCCPLLLLSAGLRDSDALGVGRRAEFCISVPA